MKKILVLILSVFILMSCGQTKYNDLASDEKEEVDNYVLGVYAPEIGKAMKMAFDFSLSEEEQEKNTQEFEANLEEIFETNIKQKFPEVDFGTFDEFQVNANTDNSIIKDGSESEIEKEKVEYEKIPLGSFGEFIDSDDSDKKYNIKIQEIIWSGNDLSSDWLERKAKNEFLSIRLEGENIGKKPYFVGLSQWNFRLVTKDGYEYKPEESIQRGNVLEGYGGCISCDANPGDKNIEDIVFDIKKIDLAGAKLISDSYQIELSL